MDAAVEGCVAIGVLLLSSGLLWTIAYLLMIRQGFRDGVCGLPMVALCANLAWELIFAVVLPDSTPQRYVNMVWLVLDLVLLYQLLRFGPREFPALERRGFYMLVAVVFTTCFGLILLLSREFGDAHGTYAAFGQNLLMSALFVGMVLQRGSAKGQSKAIAITKLLGTLCASLAFAMIMPESRLLPFLYGAILLFDLLYLALLLNVRRLAPRPRAPSPLFTPRVPPVTTATGLPWYREN
jgi:hypothetical protein